MEKILTELVDRLTKAHRSSLTSVVLYGSAATAEGKDKLSDFNILCVLKQIGPDELALSEPTFRWWRDLKNPAPLLLSEAEVKNGTDCFPMEFHDIKERHRILFGDDVVVDLDVDDSFYRAQVEHEMRAKMLRLRQKAGGVLSDKVLLSRLMAESVSTFCVLFRHALRMAGEQPLFGKHEVVQAASRKFGIDAAPFEELLQIREGKSKPGSVPPVKLFKDYLTQIEIMVDAVDRMEK